MRPWWQRCAQVSKPEVGVLHFHRRAWTPWRIASVWYQPPSRTVMYPVPEAAWGALLEAESFEEAMALLRRSDSVTGSGLVLGAVPAD